MAITVDNATLTDYDVAVGAGSVDADTQRVTLASDDPAVAALQIIDNLVLTEDVAHASGNPGVLTFAVRSDAGGTLVSDDGDNSPLQVDASGALRVTGGGGGTQYTEDAAAAADPVGNALILVRDDVLSAQTTTDGDNVAVRGTDKGEMYVKHVDAIPVTDNGGVLTVDGTVAVTGTVDLGATDNAVLDAIAASVAAIDVDATTIIGHVDGIEGLLTTIDADTGSILTSVQLADDVVVVLGTATYTEATSSGNAIGAVRRDADTTLVGTTNEWGPLQMDANGRLKVEAFSGEALPVTLTSTTITGTVTVDSELPTAAAISAENTAAPTAPSIYSFPLLFDGTNWDRSPGNSTDGTLVNLGANNDVTVTSISAGDNNIGNMDIVTMPNVTLAAGTNTNEVVGDAAHDAGIAGNPLRVAGRALTADYTAVATGDTADLIATILGKLVVKPYALPGQQWVYAAAAGGLVNTTAVTIKAAGAAGVRNYITDLTVINGHATVSTEVLIRDGASGTVIHRGWAQAVGGGYSIKFGSPLRGTAATLLEAVCVTSGSAIYVNAAGYEGAE